ncbi:phospholipase domain-containing protein [Actinoplanes sp. NPDC051475]|uniref:phospholipase domain-containing protein n=1 Tax=Actinoplanes sp. NPDC051475 TaxID=3157225 RepID=UPI00344E7596
MRLPDTDDFKPADLVRHPDEVPVPPAEQELPGQEKGVRPARALPYALHADGEVTGETLTITFRNVGRATAVFQARSAREGEDPRSYTVEPGKALTGTWSASGRYDVAVHGPNGFHRDFRGGTLGVRTDYDSRAEKVTLTFSNPGTRRLQLTVRDAYTSGRSTVSLRAGRTAAKSWSVVRTRGWYDLTVTDGTDLEYRCAGHVENGKDSISDPLMGGLIG